MRLGVDFGTSHTVAVLSRPDGRADPLLFDASPLLPSAVFAAAGGELLTGRDAERSARLEPAAYEPHPKRRIDEGMVLLGEQEFTVVAIITAILRRVTDEAVRTAGGPVSATVLTHPAGWGPQRRALLLDAAARAGLPTPSLVPEPVAAAMYFTSVLGHVVPFGHALVVYDFGGGTFDISVLRRRTGDGGDGWDVVAAEGLDDVGGVDLDAAIVGWVGRQVGGGEPWQRLAAPRTVADRRHRRALWDDARSIKEMLSRATTGGLAVPVFDVDLHLTRPEFESLARPWLDRTVALTTTTLSASGVHGDGLAGVFLVGGASRVPLVATLLHRALRVAPEVLEQPELVVALGSLLIQPTAEPPLAWPPAASPPPVSPAAVESWPAEPATVELSPAEAAPSSADVASAGPSDVDPPSAWPSDVDSSVLDSSPASPVGAGPASVGAAVAELSPAEPPVVDASAGDPRLGRSSAADRPPVAAAAAPGPDLSEISDSPPRKPVNWLFVALGVVVVFGLIGVMAGAGFEYPGLESGVFSPLMPKAVLTLIALTLSLAATGRAEVAAYRVLAPVLLVIGGGLLGFVIAVLIFDEPVLRFADGVRFALVDDDGFFSIGALWIFIVVAVGLVAAGVLLAVRRGNLELVEPPRRRAVWVWALLWVLMGIALGLGTNSPVGYKQWAFHGHSSYAVAPSFGLYNNSGALSWYAAFTLGQLLTVGSWLLVGAALRPVVRRRPRLGLVLRVLVIVVMVYAVLVAVAERKYYNDGSSVWVKQLDDWYWGSVISGDHMSGLTWIYPVLGLVVGLAVAVPSFVRAQSQRYRK